MKVGVSTSTISTLSHHHMGTSPRFSVDIDTMPISYTDKPPRVDVSTIVLDVLDAEHGIANFEACFPGYSHVTIMRTLLVTFFVDNELIPMKIEKVPSI
jgi:hypothetical protein